MRALALLLLLPLAALGAHPRALQPSAAEIAAARALAPQHQQRAAPPQRRMTNAERMQRGLPVLRPRNLPPATRTTAQRLAARASASPSASPSAALSRRAAPPPSFTAVIRVSTASNGSVLGFIAPTTHHNELGVSPALEDATRVLVPELRPGLNTALEVSFAAPADARFPCIGAVQGAGATSAHLAPGSANYAYITGTESAEPHTPPAAAQNAFSAATAIRAPAECALWAVNTLSGALAPEWTNPAGDIVKPTSVALHEGDGVLVLTADVGAFADAFGPASEVKLTLVSVADA